MVVERENLGKFVIYGCNLSKKDDSFISIVLGESHLIKLFIVYVL